MFGKNYDKDINHLDNEIKTCDKNIGTLNKNLGRIQELLSLIQDSMIDMAKVQAQHKEFITFFINHGTVDGDAQDDLVKMIQNMAKTAKIAKKNK